MSKYEIKLDKSQTLKNKKHMSVNQGKPPKDAKTISSQTNCVQAHGG